MFLFIIFPLTIFYTNENSNTSHVLIYHQLRYENYGYYEKFKYISCSYLSCSPPPLAQVISRFKYISCSYLSILKGYWTFYWIIFKYISCSYLSRFPRELLNGARNSNTSHVLIYLNATVLLFCSFTFKYISCSYLSVLIHCQGTAGSKFKYISCSYLSSICSWNSWRGHNSNTSHVLIYPGVVSVSVSIKIIQIHLMFLFIPGGLA